MNFVSLFIRRPVATTLLAVAVCLPGIVAYFLLPIASLPQVDFPSITVSANLPGASPETMAATVATPLERALGRISSVTEMTSTNTQGATRINLQFELDRDIDAAAREVQAAIMASRSLLPPDMPASPTYRKANAASGPILALALTSPTRTRDQLYDIAFTTLAQRIAQVPGVGNVGVNGSALRAVRVEVDPGKLVQLGVSLEQVRRALASRTSDLPRGVIESDEFRYHLSVDGQARNALAYRDLIVHSTPNGVVRLEDIALVEDSVQELRNAGSSGGKPAVMLVVMNQPGANVVATVDEVRSLLPQLETLVPADVSVEVVIDRSSTIRRSLREVEETLVLSVILVVLVTFVFLKSGRATLIPSIAIPVSLCGTVAVIHALGFSLNNLSLMALIISTGFVVDDAIVVLENAVHHVERGMSPRAAALRSIKDVGFTVVAMSVSLVAVFIPLLFMDGIVGRLFREFAVTLSVAVGLSMFVSLTVTPMLCAHWLMPGETSVRAPSCLTRVLTSLVDVPFRVYKATLPWALRRRGLMLCVLASSIGLTVYMYTVIPKGFFPQQDTGRLMGFFRADQSISFTAMRSKVEELMRIVGADPDVATYYEYGGGAAGTQFNTGSMFGLLRPRAERKSSADQVVQRLRPQLAKVAGASLTLTAQQDLNIGARIGTGQYQYTLLSSDLAALANLAGRFKGVLSTLTELTDVTSDYQDRGLQATVVVDRDAAARLGLTAGRVDAALNDAFGQRIVSTLYEPLNQYYVVLTVAAPFATGPESFQHVYVYGDAGQKVPLSAIARWDTTSAPLAVNHQGQFAAVTFSFNLAEGVALDRASEAVSQALRELHPEGAIRGAFAGTARAFLDSVASQPWLILAALVTVYIVLGMLYESLTHPLTILSTLPSAGVGALLSLMLMKEQFTLIALIGVILLVGIVKKNAIMLIDCALALERNEHLSSNEAIHRACLERFRPILMTTLAALFGALPLALGAGDGAELRRPLGISIVGGLVFSQALTLYTTPVVYGAIARARDAWSRPRRKKPRDVEILEAHAT